MLPFPAVSCEGSPCNRPPDLSTPVTMTDGQLGLRKSSTWTAKPVKTRALSMEVYGSGKDPKYTNLASGLCFCLPVPTNCRVSTQDFFFYFTLRKAQDSHRLANKDFLLSWTCAQAVSSGEYLLTLATDSTDRFSLWVCVSFLWPKWLSRMIPKLWTEVGKKPTKQKPSYFWSSGLGTRKITQLTSCLMSWALRDCSSNCLCRYS